MSTEKPQTIRIAVGYYNARRYGKPWIARAILWETGDTLPTLEWGAYVGDDEGGELQLTAKPGEVIRWGQRDGRQPSRSTAYYGVVAADGQIHCVGAVKAKRVMDGDDVDLPEACVMSIH